MSIRYVCSAMTIGLTLTVLAISQKQLSAQSGLVLPTESTMITVTGCLQHGGKHDKYMLVNATLASVNSVPDQACSGEITSQSIELKDMGKFDLRKSLLGRWIQITGRLERLESGDEPEDYREVHVRGYTPVPLAPPQAAAAPKLEFPSDFEVKQPQPRAGYDAGIAQAEPPAPSGEKPVVTTGVVDTRVLPATASSLPEIGLLSMLMLAGAFALRQLERRRVQERR